MIDVLADTNAIVWYLFDSGRLSTPAKTALATAASNGRILISAITLVELDYLAGRKSFPYAGALGHLVALLDDPAMPLEILPLTFGVAKVLGKVVRDEVPDMPDRIIGATAVAHQLPLVTADAKLLSSASLGALVPVIW